MASPIHKIPNELLGKILMHVPRFIDSHLSEINCLTLVCKLWRQVAIATPSIWFNIPVDCPRRTSLYLRRSKNALIFINELCSAYFPSTHSIQLVLTHLHRIKILRLTFRDQSNLLLQAFSHNATAPSGHFLQHLDIRLYPSTRRNSTVVRTLPPHFLSTRLVTLALEGADLPTKLPVFSNLIRLTLHYPPLHQTWGEFAALFRATPALRQLSLNGRGSPVSNDFTPHHVGPIRLPHLSKLHLHHVYPASHCSAMLDQMEYPSHVHPNITMPARPGLYLTPLFKHCSYLGLQSPLEPCLSTSLTVSYSRHYFDVSLATTKTSDPLFRVHGPLKHDKIFSVLKSTCASLNLAHVRDLSTDIKVPLGIPLDHCFPSRLLTGVQTMHVSHRLTDVATLLDRQTVRNESVLGIPFPQLESLTLHHCSLTDDHIERLASIFSKRSRLGCGPPQITILEDPRCSALSRQSVALLQAQCAVTLDPGLLSDDLGEGSVGPSFFFPPPSPTIESFGVTEARSPILGNTGLIQASTDPQIQVPSPQSYPDGRAATSTLELSSAPTLSKPTPLQNPSLVNVAFNQPSVDPQFLRHSPLLSIKLPRPLSC